MSLYTLSIFVFLTSIFMSGVNDIMHVNFCTDAQVCSGDLQQDYWLKAHEIWPNLAEVNIQEDSATVLFGLLTSLIDVLLQVSEGSQVRSYYCLVGKLGEVFNSAIWYLSLRNLKSPSISYACDQYGSSPYYTMWLDNFHAICYVDFFVLNWFREVVGPIQ